MFAVVDVGSFPISGYVLCVSAGSLAVDTEEQSSMLYILRY